MAHADVLRVDAGDGTGFDLTVYPPDGGEAAPVVVLGPAMGVRASYYAPLAEAFREHGTVAVTMDLRGLGTSSVRAGRACDFGYREIVELDFPAAVAALRERFPEAPLFVLGHSLGGQLACLYAAIEAHALAGIVLIASCSVHHRGWPFPKNVAVFGFQQLARLWSRLLGYFPGRLVGFGGREARRLMRDWSHQGRTGRYEPAGSGHDYEALLARLELPILSLTFTDDHYCPRRAAEGLLHKMPAGRTRFLQLSPQELGLGEIGHFAWVKQPGLVVPRIVEWIRVSSPTYKGEPDAEELITS